MKENVFYDYDFCDYNHEGHQKYILLPCKLRLGNLSKPKVS
jgi:hypothetical protein